MNNLIIASLGMLHDELCKVMWNRNQEEYESPFLNTGNRFSCDVFQVRAYDWSDEPEVNWNFKWQDVEISWCKYYGRGLEVISGTLNPERCSKMLNECLEAIESFNDLT